MDLIGSGMDAHGMWRQNAHDVDPIFYAAIKIRLRPWRSMLSARDIVLPV
jgi:hypothetical protein